MLTELFERAASRLSHRAWSTHSAAALNANFGVTAGACVPRNNAPRYARGENQNPFALGFVVEATLADEVHGLFRADISVCETAVRDGVELVLGAHRERFLEFSRFCVSGTKLFLQFIDFITRSGLLFLQGKRGILNVYDAIVDRLLHLGELQFISRCDCCFCQIDGILQAGDGGRDSHDWHRGPRREIGRALPRRNHHSVLAAGAGVHWGGA